MTQRLTQRLTQSSPVVLALALLATPCGTAFAEEPATTEVVIRAAAVDRHSTRDASVDSTILRHEDLNRPGVSAAQAIATAPGVQLRQTGGTLEPVQLSLRGGNSAQLPIYLGDVPLNDELTGTADISFVSPLILERIEIYRGHAPRFTDQLGLSGAVVLVPKLPKATRLFARLGTGSYGTNEELMGASVATERAGSLVMLHRLHQDNNYSYLDNRGTAQVTNDDREVTRSNADATSNELYGSGFYRPSSSSSVRWFYQGLDREQGVTGLGVIPAMRARSRLRREFYSLGTTVPCTVSAHVERCGISVSSEFAQSRQQLTDPAYELGYGAIHIDNVARSYTQRIRVEHRATDKLSLGWLLSARASNVSLWEDQAAVLNAQRITVIPGFDAEYATSDRILFNLVARSQVARTKADSNQSNSTPLATGRVGTRFLLSDNLSVFANVGRYYRSPTLAELFGTGPQIRGNAELLPESGFGEDLGLMYQQLGSFYQLSASASAYHQELKELVAWQRSSFGQIRPYNVGSARLLGSDFYLGLALWDSLRVDSSLSLLEPRDTEDNRPYKNDLLPYRSRLVQNSMLTVSLPKHLRPRFIRSVSSWLVHQQRSNRYAVRAGNVVLPATSTTDVGVAMGLPLIPVTLRGQVANLFASQNYDLVGMPLPQRNWAISAEFDFTVTP